MADIIIVQQDVDGTGSIWAKRAEAAALASEGIEESVTEDAAQVALDRIATGEAVVQAQAWAESPTAPDPLDPTSKSAKTHATEAGQSAAAALQSEESADDHADRAEAWAESPTAPDPLDPTSKSAKTWAGEAEGFRDQSQTARDEAVAAAATVTSPSALAIQLLRFHNPALVFQGFAATATATPSHVANHAWIAVQSGTIFGIAGVQQGQIVISSGTSFRVETIANTRESVDLLMNLSFTTSFVTADRSAETFTLAIGTDFYTEKQTFFNLTNRLFNNLVLNAGTSGTFEVAIVTLSGSVSTILSTRVLSATTGINRYTLSDIVDPSILSVGTDYFVFLAGVTGASGVVRYASLTNGSYAILKSAPTVSANTPFKFNFWLEVLEPNVLTQNEKRYLLGQAVPGFDVAAACAAQDIVFIPPGTHAITAPIELRAGQKIHGIRGLSILQANSTTTAIFTATNKQNVLIEDVTLQGVMPNYSFTWQGVAAGIVDTVAAAVAKTGIGTKSGVRITSNSNNIVLSRVSIRNFDEAGVLVDDVGATYGPGFRINDCLIEQCYAGVLLQNEAEYSNINSTTVRFCQIGVHKTSGNVITTACLVQQCRVGVVVASGLNEAHGSFVGCSFNHHTLHGIIVDEIGIGEVFSGNQHWYGSIYIRKSRGVQITGSTIAAGSVFLEGTHVNGGINMLSDCLFKFATINQNHLGDPSSFVLRNNFNFDTGSSSGLVN